MVSELGTYRLTLERKIKVGNTAQYSRKHGTLGLRDAAGISSVPLRHTCTKVGKSQNCQAWSAQSTDSHPFLHPGLLPFSLIQPRPR